MLDTHTHTNIENSSNKYKPNLPAQRREGNGLAAGHIEGLRCITGSPLSKLGNNVWAPNSETYPRMYRYTCILYHSCINNKYYSCSVLCTKGCIGVVWRGSAMIFHGLEASIASPFNAWQTCWLIPPSYNMTTQNTPNKIKVDSVGI